MKISFLVGIWITCFASVIIIEIWVSTPGDRANDGITLPSWSLIFGPKDITKVMLQWTMLVKVQTSKNLFTWKGQCFVGSHLYWKGSNILGKLMLNTTNECLCSLFLHWFCFTDIRRPATKLEMLWRKRGIAYGVKWHKDNECLNWKKINLQSHHSHVLFHR